MCLRVLPDSFIRQISPKVRLDRTTTTLRHDLMHIYLAGKGFMHYPIYLYEVRSNICNRYSPERCFLALLLFLALDLLLFRYGQCLFQAIHSLKLIREVWSKSQAVYNLAFCNLASALLNIGKAHDVTVLLFLDALSQRRYISGYDSVCQ